jgi:ssDNA-binding replication factor A large subunit
MDVESLYLLVEDLITKDRFLREIEKRRKEYGNLLNDEAIAYMIVDELGRNPGNKMKIVDLYDGINATIEARVDRIGEIEIKKNGQYRLMRVDISDETGSCQLVLWNDEIDEVGKNLKEGMKIKIINGYVKENIYGLQVSLGRWGVLVIL